MSGRSMLVIDDEPAIGTLIRRAGEATGYAVRAVSDAAVFRHSFREERPSVICLDLAMPGTDGVELLRFLAAEGCRAQLLVISGYDGAMVGAAVRLGEALGLNIAGVLPKPIRMSELRDILSNLGQSGCPAAA